MDPTPGDAAAQGMGLKHNYGGMPRESNGKAEAAFTPCSDESMAHALLF
jgi:hypothetical protein